jgi:hypothetical protein
MSGIAPLRRRTIQVDSGVLPEPATKLVITQHLRATEDPPFWAWIIVGAFFDEEENIVWSTEIFAGHLDIEQESDEESESTESSDSEPDEEWENEGSFDSEPSKLLIPRRRDIVGIDEVPVAVYIRALHPDRRLTSPRLVLF